MRNWIHRIKIRDISEDKKYDSALEYTKQKRDYNKEMTKRLEKYSFIPKRIVSKFLKIKTLLNFNKTLDSLYDYCDVNDIWIEF